MDGFLITLITTMEASPSFFFFFFFLEIYLEGFCPQSTSFCYCWSFYHFSAVTRGELVSPTSRETRGSGRQAPLSIKGRASHQDYWASNDENAIPRIPAGFFWVAAGLFWVYNILLLSIVHVIGRCLLGRRALSTAKSWHLQDKLGCKRIII